MIVKTKMNYLGFETKTSNKSGNSYLLVKFMEMSTSAVFEFYVPGDRIAITTAVGQLQPFQEEVVRLKISSFNGKPQVDLEGIGEVKQ